MAQAPKFTRNYDFADFQSSNPTTPLPADQVESELNEIKSSTDAIIDNLALIQRDDGALANASVHVAALSTAVKNLLLLSSVNIRGAWATATLYAVGDVVIDAGTPYVCYVAHTSSGAIDLTKFASITAPIEVPDDPTDDDKFLRASGGAGVWVDLTAAMITNIVAGLQSVITAADVGAARTALGITASGDAIATAASAAAQRTALGASTIGGTIFTAANEAAVITALAVPTLAAANTFTATQTVQSADAGADDGPHVVLDRNSASPADNDLIGALLFNGRSDLPTTRTMARLIAQVIDVSDTEEDARLLLQTIVAGSLATRGYVGQGLVIGSPTDGDKGAGTVNAEALYVNGVAGAGGGAWETVTSGSITSAASLDLELDTATYNEFRLILQKIKTENAAGAILWLRMSDDGASTFETAGYLWAGVRGDSGAGAATSSSDAEIQLTIDTAVRDSASEWIDAVIEIINPQKQEKCPVRFSCSVDDAADSALNAVFGWGRGPTAADVTDIRVLFATADIESGDYVLLGRRP